MLRSSPCPNIYVVDFFSHHLKLVIEIDGLIQYEPDQIVKDQEREEKLKDLGLTILSLGNDQVCCDLENVKDKILMQILKSRGLQYPL